MKLDLKLFNQTYSVNCTSDDVAELESAAELLNQQMNQLKSQTQLVSHDKLLVMICLQLAQENLRLKAPTGLPFKDYQQTLHSICRDIEKVL
jgi:cell division protein ZapA